MNKRIKEKKGWMKNEIEVNRMNVKINELGNKWEKMERKNERKNIRRIIIDKYKQMKGKLKERRNKK